MPSAGDSLRTSLRGGAAAALSPKLLRRLERLPRMEIHLHLEGSVSLTRLRILWDRPGRDPGLPSDPGFLYRHRSFPEFLGHFGLVTRAIRSPEDLFAITTDLCRSLKRQGVVAAEVLFSPVTFTRRGLPFSEMMDALTEAATQEAKRGGPTVGWILDGVRQWGSEGFEELLECARAARGKVLGVGIGGDERSLPAGAFADLYREARRMGLRTVAHAGEFDSARSVREAVEILGAERIGHGIRAVEDREVLRLLRRQRVPLEICPTSNLRTGVIRRWRDHPLPRLIRSGVRVTLNSDDPALFGTSLSEEYRRAHRRLGIEPETLFRIHLETIRSSFLSPRAKRQLEARSRSVWEESGGLRPVRGRSRRRGRAGRASA